MALMRRFGVVAAVAVCAFALAGCSSPSSVPVASHPAREVTSCPARPSAKLAPSSLPDAVSQLVPLKPTAVLVCHYGAMPSVSLQSSTSIDSAKVAAELASFLDHTGSYETRPINCPMDDGESVYFVFSSPTTSSPLILELSGCRNASNGSTFRLGVVLTPKLMKLAGLPAPH